MANLETILSWFQAGDYPTQEEFEQTFSSFRHKDTKIPITEVDGLESSLNNKLNVSDYVKDGKIRADKIESLDWMNFIESNEKDISEFAANSDKYEFQQNDFIAVINEQGNFSLYLFKGGEKSNKNNYLPIGISNTPSGDYIPLTGTETGKPVTGELEIKAPVSIGSDGYSLVNTVNGLIEDDLGSIHIKHDQEINLHANDCNFKFNENGISSDVDFSDNVKELHYVQKKYVDNAISSVPTDEDLQDLQSTLLNKADLVDGKVPASQLPSYVDDVLEFPDLSSFPVSGESGKIYIALDSNKTYRWSGSTYVDLTQPEVDTLQNVMNRGNFAPKEIMFHANGKLSYSIPLESYFFTSGISETATGKYNTGIGYKVFSKLTTGYENTGLGGRVLEELTTGYYNVGYGTFSLSKATAAVGNVGIGYACFYNTTTGNGNTGLGLNTGQNNITGSINTYIGWNAGFSCNGSNNVFVGGGAGRNHGATTGSKIFSHNTFLGYNSGYTSHAMGTWGDNNVVIGSNAPLGGGTNNQLVIDSYMSPKRHDLVFPLIGGDFSARTLSFDASLKIRRLTDAENDVAYSRILVQREDGTIGYQSKPSISSIPLAGTETDKPVTGEIQFNNSGSKGLFAQSINLDGELTGGFYSAYIGNDQVAFNYLSDDSGSEFVSVGIARTGLENKSALLLSDSRVDSRGITASQDFSLNITDLDYVQKKYVDDIAFQIVSPLNSQTFNIEGKGNAVVRTQIHKDYVVVELNMSVSNLAVDETITIPILNTFRFATKPIQAFKDFDSYEIVNLIVFANNANGLSIVNKNDTDTGQFYIQDTFIFGYGIDAGAY
ncbi:MULTISPECIES: hypothetical protein [Chryseobacterium]|uniref:Uncharacterized protein n=1 Tax=Chryseobacterium taihuense TaxID=1141221 RepID=A0A4U8WI37_9FLAO|nr:MULTISPECIES: hypothetical protein [Chryseobacterium]QQV01659.1 hypothetical protein I6I61_11220 [Chryseobacterium sp. FDAARGOS 1104]VFB05140.1 Uncharacterised protein [Chryseobacterium taihuense]